MDVIRLSVSVCVLIICSCASAPSSSPNPPPCSESWYRYVEDKLHTGDSDGHGPDLGSAEWRSVVEFKLGIRGNPGIPHPESDQWCTYIERKLAR